MLTCTDARPSMWRRSMARLKRELASRTAVRCLLKLLWFSRHRTKRRCTLPTCPTAAAVGSGQLTPPCPNRSPVSTSAACRLVLLFLPWQAAAGGRQERSHRHTRTMHSPRKVSAQSPKHSCSHALSGRPGSRHQQPYSHALTGRPGSRHQQPCQELAPGLSQPGAVSSCRGADCSSSETGSGLQKYGPTCWSARMRSGTPGPP